MEEYAESKDLEILGFYFAHEGLNEAAQGPPIPIRRLQEQIEARRVNSTGDAKGKGKDVAVTGSRVVPNTFEVSLTVEPACPAVQNVGMQGWSGLTVRRFRPDLSKQLDNANLTSDSKAFRLVSSLSPLLRDAFSRLQRPQPDILFYHPLQLPCTTLPSSSSTITFSTESSPPPPASLKVNPQQAVIAPKAPKSKPASPSRVPGLIKANEHLKLCDFDAHLEDMGARWLENELVEL